MTVKLINYTEKYESQTIERIALFFHFHSSLVDESQAFGENNYKIAMETLKEWINEPNELYMILTEIGVVGFLHLSYKGSNVAWIEDIYVDSEHRNKGVATQAIRIAEDIIKSHPEYTAVCFDVVPRNESALKLYHKLGYDNLSIVTVRKELYDNKRDKKISIADLEFNF